MDIDNGDDDDLIGQIEFTLGDVMGSRSQSFVGDL
jgi:hypothetical protein